MSEVLTQFMEAIKVAQKSGAVINEISVDRKTMDRLWFDMNQRDIRHRASVKREPYYYIEILGVAVTEAPITDDVCRSLTKEIMERSLSETVSPAQPIGADHD